MKFIDFHFRLTWGSPSVILKSPLKLSSPKLSERVTSPLTTASTVSPGMFLSPSKGVGIGSVWSSALDEQLSKSSTESSSKTLNTKEVGKENISTSMTSKTDLGGTQVTKPSKIIIDREVLSPEMVKFYVC